MKTKYNFLFHYDLDNQFCSKVVNITSGQWQGLSFRDLKRGWNYWGRATVGAFILFEKTFVHDFPCKLQHEPSPNNFLLFRLNFLVSHQFWCWNYKYSSNSTFGNRSSWIVKNVNAYCSTTMNAFNLIVGSKHATRTHACLLGVLLNDSLLLNIPKIS
jgi:hypothetical protein